MIHKEKYLYKLKKRKEKRRKTTQFKTKYRSYHFKKRHSKLGNLYFKDEEKKTGS